MISAASESAMPVHVIIDRDFRTETEINKLTVEAQKAGIVLTIWNKKEIENYFLHAGAVSRLITRRGKAVVTEQEAEKLILEACKAVCEESIGAIADRYHQADKSEAHSTVRKRAEKAFKAMVAARGLLSVVPGKRVISKASEASKKRFGVSFGAMAICKEMRPSEFDPVLVRVIEGLA